MDHLRVIKRAWQITWNYRVLWVFGFVLALTAGVGGGGSGGSFPIDESDVSNWFSGGDFNIPGFTQSIQDIVGVALTLFIVFACLGILFAIVFTIAHYVSETALFRMVNQHEEDESKYSFKEGFRLGWSKSAFNLFLMDLIVSLAGFMVFALLILVAAIPLLSWLVENDVIRVIGTVAAASFGLLVLFLGILTSIALSLILQFARRACVLENRGIIDALQEGFNMVRSRLGDSIIMGLILFGIGLAFSIIMVPVVIILVLLAAFLGGLPGLLAYWIASMALEGAAPYIIAGIVALPLFLLVVIVPPTILEGIFETFKSSVWTLTFREFRSLAQSSSMENEPDPVQNPPAVGLIEPVSAEIGDNDKEEELNKPKDEVEEATESLEEKEPEEDTSSPA